MRRAFATLLVLWVVAIVAVVLVGVQQTAWEQAAHGREAVGRVRAKWAARAGVEAAISQIAYNTIEPDTTSATTILFDLEEVAYASLDHADYAVEHEEAGRVLAGPADAHAKLNVNTLDTDSLMTLDYMTEDTADAILDWIDGDDDTRPLGAELGYYLSLTFPHEPRNDFIRSIAELELIAGTDPLDVRGEDDNLNGVRDDNEDDGNLSWPADEPDGELDGGWSQWLTASSLDGGYGLSGEPRMSLVGGDPAELARRTGLTNEQAEVVIQYANTDIGSIEALISTNLNLLIDPSTGERINPTVAPIASDQLGPFLDEVVFDGSVVWSPGKLNVNTCDEEIFDYLPGIDVAIADQIILERDGRSGGFVMFADLLDIPGMNNARLAALHPILEVRSNVFVVTSRGTDRATGIEFEMIATVDRTRLPVVIQELRTP